MSDTAPPSSETGFPNNADETRDAKNDGIPENACACKDLIRSNPMLTVLVVLIIGFFLGNLVPHWDQIARRRRFIDDPLDNLQSLARTCGERAARQASRGSDAAASAMESIWTSIKETLKF